MRFWALPLVLLGFAGVLLAQERARAELEYEEGPIVIEADRLTRESADLWIAHGNVVITYQNMILKAPYIAYNPLTGAASAEGGVQLTRGIQWLRGSRVELNLQTDRGVIHDAEGFTDEELYVRADRLLKTGPDRYTAQDGFVTACEEAVPKWSFRINSATIRPGGTARLQHTLFRVKNIPVFYFPLLFIPTADKERSSGFLMPTTGNSNVRGRRISNSFYLVLGRSADILFREDYFSRRGFGHGVTFRTRPNAVTSLELDWYFVDDRKDQGGTAFNGIGQTELPHGFRAVADFNIISSFIFRQVFSDNFFAATQPTERSNVFVSNHFQSGAFNFQVSREETIFPGRNAVIRSSPLFNFKLIGERIFDTPLHVDLDSSVEGLSRTDRFLDTPGLTQRLDLFPQLYFSVPVAQGLRFTPRFGFRNTFYSDSLEAAEEGEELSLTGDNLNRQYFEFTADLQGWGLSKVRRNASGSGWKHLIEPVVRYRYLTGIEDFNRILRFDEKDAIANTNEVEYSLFNRFFVKRNTAEGALNHEWLSLQIGQKYFLDPDFDAAFVPGAVNQFFPLNTFTGFHYGALQRNFSPVTSHLRFSPQPGYSFDVRGDYDPEFNRFRNFSVTGFLARPGLFLATTYFVTEELEEGTFESNQVQAQVAIGNLRRGLSGSAILAYDAVLDRFLTYRTRVNYFWDCCGVSVEFQGFNIGVRREDQLRFSIFLKGLGNFGTIQHPERMF